MQRARVLLFHARRFCFAVAVAVLAATAFEGCELFGGGGGGGGGGAGGGSAVSFTRGFTYVRRDDRNVYVADEADFQTAGVLTVGAGASTPSLSKDGRQLVFVRKTGLDTELATVPVIGGVPTTVLRPTGTARNFRTPVFSLDAQRIAFAYDDGTVSAVGLVNADGSSFQRLAGGGSLAYGSPSFFADGAALLVATGTPGLGFTGLERLDVATATPTPITNTFGAEAQAIGTRAVVSPDGTKAVFDARVASGATRIFVIDLASRQVAKVNDYVNEPGTNDTAPCWMDAATVAYSSDSGGNDNVYKVSTTGTGRKLLLPKAIEAWYGPLP